MKRYKIVLGSPRFFLIDPRLLVWNDSFSMNCKKDEIYKIPNGQHWCGTAGKIQKEEKTKEEIFNKTFYWT